MSETPETEVLAWLGYWPGAGSVNSETHTTHRKHYADQWRDEGVEITPLVPLAAYQSAIQERDVALALAANTIAEAEVGKKLTADTLTALRAAEASNASLRQQLDGVRVVASEAKRLLEALRLGKSVHNERTPNQPVEGPLWDQIWPLLERLDAALKSSEPKE